MWHYLFLGLRQQRGRSILVTSGFVVAACTVILLSATTQTTVFRTTQIINQNWRPTYDLVVVPAHEAVSQGTAIPPDQFEGYNGGISMGQYEQIRQLPGISVAAPIAFISYALFPTTTIELGSSRLAPGFYQLDWTLTAFNGQQQITEYQSSTDIFASDSCSGFCDLSMSQQDQLAAIGVGDYFFPLNGPYLTGVPNPGSFLLAAIDPVAENQLVHLDNSIVQGSPLPSQKSLSLDATQPAISGMNANVQVPNYDVPLLINTQLPSKITLHASFNRLLTDVTDPQRIAALGGSSYLDRLPQQTIFSGDVRIAQNNLQIFSKGAVLAQNGSSLGIQDAGQSSFALNFTARPSSLTYRSTPSPAGLPGPTYTLVPSSPQNPAGTSGSEVAFRPLNPLPGTTDQQDGTIGYTYQAVYDTIYNGNTYTAQPVGEFDGSRLSAQFANVLNWLPENTYTSSPIVLHDDAQGHPVAPTNILPTTNQAGFTLQPPLALTTLAAAQQICGDDCISVIRVRVTGNVTPNEAGWKRVAQVAQEIDQRTGLQAIVTLGSSPQSTLVYIPGVKAGQYPGATQTIPPVGWVEERWIVVGAGIDYLNQVGATQTLLLGAVLLVCLGYVAVTMSSLVSSQRRALAVLSAVGWRPWHSAGMFLVQALLLSLSGGIIGTGLAVLIVYLIGISPPWDIAVLTLPGILGLTLLSVLYPLWRVWTIHPAEILRSGSTVTRERVTTPFIRGNAWFWSHVFPVSGLAVRNLARARVRSLITIGSLFLSALLLTVMVNGILTFRQMLQGTLLGNYVLLQTAVPQIAGVAFSVALTFLSVADLLVLQARERQGEIGLLQAVGWHTKVVQNLFLQEGLTLAVVGTIPGVSIALGILWVQQQVHDIIPALLVGVGAIGLLSIVSTLATIPAIRLISRLHLADILRME
ncbi:MAG: ABC transporter permease [Ktedonobacterales bacterium]